MDHAARSLDWTWLLHFLGSMDAWDGMCQVHVRVHVGGALVARLESLVGLRNGAAIARLGRTWWRCWSNCQRHVLLREFGFNGLYPSLADLDEGGFGFDPYSDDSERDTGPR